MSVAVWPIATATRRIRRTVYYYEIYEYFIRDREVNSEIQKSTGGYSVNKGDIIFVNLLIAIYMCSRP
jgi:hypothetical protein